MSNSKEELQSIIKEYIKKNLTVELWEREEFFSEYLEVVISLEDEEISKDFIKWGNP